MPIYEFLFTLLSDSFLDFFFFQSTFFFPRPNADWEKMDGKSNPFEALRSRRAGLWDKHDMMIALTETDLNSDWWSDALWDSSAEAIQTVKEINCGSCIWDF